MARRSKPFDQLLAEHRGHGKDGSHHLSNSMSNKISSKVHSIIQLEVHFVVGPFHACMANMALVSTLLRVKNDRHSIIFHIIRSLTNHVLYFSVFVCVSVSIQF